ncbi:uncharacterized protein ATNIH1004_011342 [Aspergillus tanneri]|nr:uncharacterized protein ATNIH1004_011342 [Aspergillus tanneri]KAA8642398.1 hypothetical protein ATNIH1004_011342 [Aspergillus tanneri]
MQSIGVTTGSMAGDTSIMPQWYLAAEQIAKKSLESGTTLMVNLKSAYRRGNDDMRLQSQYDPADCRLSYALENIFQPATTWVSAVNALCGDGKCV